MRLATKHKGLHVRMSVESLGFDKPQPVWRAYRSVRDEFNFPSLEYVQGTTAGTLAECKALINDLISEANQS